MSSPFKILDIVGERFGLLVAIKDVGRDRYGRMLWQFRCDCGEIVIRAIHCIKISKHKSCGCRLPKRESAMGMSRTRIYRTWNGLIQRCTNPKNQDYQYYGGRGITVCERWLKFEFFYEDMIGGYAENLTIDRIKNDDNYYKENCRWITQQEQLLNTSRNILITIDGQTLNAIEWGALYNIKPHTILDRLRHGHSPEDAVKWVKLKNDKRYRGRKVIDNKTGIVYDSPRLAAEAIGIDLVKVKNALYPLRKKWCDLSIVKK